MTEAANRQILKKTDRHSGSLSANTRVGPSMTTDILGIFLACLDSLFRSVDVSVMSMFQVLASWNKVVAKCFSGFSASGGGDKFCRAMSS